MTADIPAWLHHRDICHFANDNIDVVLLHHLLDYVDSPQDVLREAARVVLPMGHLVIVGFHPVSSWGLWRQVARFRGRAPWTGRFIRAGRADGLVEPVGIQD